MYYIFQNSTWYTLYINSSTIFSVHIEDNFFLKLFICLKLPYFTSKLKMENFTFEYTDFKLNGKPSFLGLILYKTIQPKAT